MTTKAGRIKKKDVRHGLFCYIVGKSWVPSNNLVGLLEQSGPPLITKHMFLSRMNLGDRGSPYAKLQCFDETFSDWAETKYVVRLVYENNLANAFINERAAEKYLDQLLRSRKNVI
jgi:hypothetical protein